MRLNLDVIGLAGWASNWQACRMLSLWALLKSASDGGHAANFPPCVCQAHSLSSVTEEHCFVEPNLGELTSFALFLFPGAVRLGPVHQPYLVLGYFFLHLSTGIVSETTKI